MKIMKHLMICIMVFGILFILSCSKKDIEDGWIKFDFMGDEYIVNQRQFMIRANPMIGEGEKIKTIDKGQSVTFEFNLGPTPSRAKQELEATGKELKQLAQGNIPERVEISQFDAVWVIKTTNDPTEILKNKISYDTPGLNLGAFMITIIVPGYSIHNPSEERHPCWVVIDEIADDRVKGTFGGTFQVEKLNAKDINEIKMFLEKEYEMNGTFDVPFKKLYRYR